MADLFVSIVNLSVTNLTLQNAIQGDIVISGRFTVYGAATFDSNVRLKQNLDVSDNITTNTLVARSLIHTEDMIVNGNLLVRGDSVRAFQHIDVCGNLVLYNQLQFGNTNAFIHSNEGQNIGINTINASATLDIVGDNARSINVYTSQPTNMNILARNNQNKGILSFTESSSSHIGFYNNRDIGETALSANTIPTPDAQIKYTSSGILSVDVSENTNIYSRMSIAPKANTTTSHVLDETMVVYGNASATPYLWTSLEKTTMNTTSVETLVSQDISTNAFLNIVAPNKQGVAIGGGRYISDASRSFGTIGLVNSQGAYYPSLNIVAGTSRVKQKFTIGINTHTPATDAYSADINGPLRIANTDTTISYRTNFEIRRMSFSRTHPKSGIAIGTPNRITQPYFHTTLYTNDGGNSWIPSDLDIFSVYNNINLFNDVFVFDNSLSVIVGTRGRMLYHTNGGARTGSNNMWNSVILSITDTLYSVFINTTKRFFTSTANTIYWFDPPADLYTANTGIIFASEDINHGVFNIVDATNVIQIRGDTDSLYIISNNQIVKYTNISTNTITYAYTRDNPHGIYKSISVLNDNYAVAVGTNIISYTNDGVNWTDIYTPYTLNSVHVYSPVASLAVGNNGTILYSIDGNHTWRTITSLFNASAGSFAVLADPSYNLTNIVMDGSGSFSVAKTTTTYSDSVRQGNSSIIYTQIPYLFNNENNSVLDISGGMRISGDINVDYNGKIASTNETFSLLNDRVRTIHFGNDASSVIIGDPSGSTIRANYDVNVLNDSSLNRHLSVGGNTLVIGDTTMRSTLLVDGDVSFNSHLRVNDTTYLYEKLFVVDDVSMGANLVVVRDSSLNGALRVDGNTQLNRRLNVVGDTSMNSRLYVDGDVSFNSRLLVIGDVSMNNRVFIRDDTRVDGNTQINQRLNVVSDVSMGANLLVLRDTSMNGDFRLDGNAQINQQMNVVGDVSFNSRLLVIGDVSMNSSVFIRDETRVDGNTQINQRLNVVSDVSMGANLLVLRDSSLNGDFRLDGNAQINQQMNVVGDVSFNSRLLVIGDVSMNSSVFIRHDTRVDGNTQLNRRLNVVSDVSMGANLLVLRDTSMNGALRVDGNTQLNRRLIVFGDVSFNSRLLVIGDVSMNSSVFIRDTTRVDGNTQINQQMNVVGDVSMGANLLVLRDSSLNGDFRLDGNAQMNQVLNVLGDVSMGSNLLVLGNATINRRAFILSDVSMGANLLVIGNTTLRKKTLAYDDITIARNGIIINELNNMNVIGEYTLDNISGSITADNYNSGALLWNNATNTYDATFNSPSSSNSTLRSGELSIFSKNTISANGLITNPFSFPGGATRVNVGMQLNMAANSNIWIMRMLFLQSDATTSAGSISFTISGAAQLLCVIGASQTTINLLNSLPTNTDFWLTISQQTASPYNLTIYLNGVSVYASNLPAFSLTSPASVRFVFGYNDTAVIPNSTRITYKRIVLDYDGDYTAPLSVYNTMNAYPSVFMPIKFSVQGNATINRNLFGLSDASFGGKLYAIGDASFGSKLYAIGDASFGSKLYVINDVSMGANLTIVGNTTINRRLYTIGDASFGSRLFVINDVSFGGKFYTIGDASFGANVRIMGNAQLDQPVIALSDVSMGSTLRVARDASFNANVRIVGNTIIDSTLAVNGNVSVNANLIVANDTQINGALSVAQRASFAQTIQMNNDLTINANAYINKNAFILLDASFGGNIYAADGSFNGNVFVNNNLTINKRLIGVDASFNNDINIKRNALVEGSLIIFGNVDVSKNTYILGDVSLNANLYVKRDQTNDGNLLVNNIVRSQYYESTSSTGNIFIGGLGLNPVGGGLAPKRNIFIGCNAEGTQQTQNTIRIGGGQDIVVLGGERGVTIENINAGKTFRLNNPATTTSEGAGIEIIDPDAGQTSSLKLAIGKGGFDFQVPTNRVKLDIQSLKLASASKAGFLSLTAIDPDNSYYSVGLGPFDVSNILLKRTTTTADVNDNIQVIDTNLGVLGNAYITRSLALGKTTAASGTILDISGNVSVNNGFIWQF